MLMGLKRPIRGGSETVIGTEIHLLLSYTLKPGEPRMNKEKCLTYTCYSVFSSSPFILV